MVIKIEKAASGSSWLVRLNDLLVPFRSMEQAQTFVDRLKTRLEAEHPIPHY